MKLHFWPVVGTLLIFLNISSALASLPVQSNASMTVAQPIALGELTAEEFQEEYKGTVAVSSKVLTLAGAMLPASLAVQSFGSQIDASHPGRAIVQLVATISIAAVSTIPAAYLAGLVPQVLLNNKIEAIGAEATEKN